MIVTPNKCGGNIDVLCLDTALLKRLTVDTLFCRYRTQWVSIIDGSQRMFLWSLSATDIASDHVCTSFCSLLRVSWETIVAVSSVDPKDKYQLDSVLITPFWALVCTSISKIGDEASDL